MSIPHILSMGNDFLKYFCTKKKLLNQRTLFVFFFANNPRAYGCRTLESQNLLFLVVFLSEKWFSCFENFLWKINILQICQTFAVVFQNCSHPQKQNIIMHKSYCHWSINVELKQVTLDDEKVNINLLCKFFT